MQILYDYQIFSMQVYGGISRYFVELANHMANYKDVQAKIIAPFYVNKHAFNLNNCIVSGRHIVRIPKTSRLLKLFNRRATKKYFDRFSPDILHETFYAKKTLNTRKKVKTVITVYDMIHERFADYFPKTDTTALSKRLAVNRADHIICISEKTKLDLLNIIEVDPEKVSVVYHGFNPPNNLPEPEGTSMIEPYILYVGARGGYKNFERLLRAYGNTPALHKTFKLVCFGGGNFTRAEKQLIQKLRIREDKIIYLKGDDYILSKLYSNAAVFVCTSLYEGFGITPLEAMSYGCPVACSNGGSIPEVVLDAGEFFNPYEVESIAQALEQVLFSNDRANILRSLGRKRITHFSWITCVEKTFEIYKSLMSST